MANIISRRKLLDLSCRSVAAIGVAAASDLMPTRMAAQSATMDAGGCDEKAVPSVSLSPGLQMHYRVDWLGAPWAKPETVLFIHGNLESGEVWYGWVPRMGQRFRLLRPDLPGFGLSTVPANFEWSLVSYASVMARFLDKVGVASAHIIGAKTGGAIAMQFAAVYPERTKSLVVASGPFAPLDPKFENSPQKLRLGSAATHEEIAYFDKLKAAMKPETRAGIARLLSAISLDSVLPRIMAPTLVITTDRSALQTVETVLRYQPKIPNSRLLVLTSDAYHVAVANADECVTSVLAFIRETR
jgi:pimeloyl-ACP methyl ester carboxylesterase